MQRQPLRLHGCYPCTCLQVINGEANYSGKSDPGLPGTLHHCGVWITSLGRGIPWLKISSVPWGDKEGQLCSPPGVTAQPADSAASLGHQLAKNL